MKRLGTDHIDLYQLHNWDGMTPIEETLEALRLLVGSGKIRYFGTSNFTAWQMMKTLGKAELHGMLKQCRDWRRCSDLAHLQSSVALPIFPAWRLLRHLPRKGLRPRH